MDRWGSVFWFSCALYVCRESLQLGIGSRSDPGPGFVFFWSGIILAFLSLIAFLRSFVAHNGTNEVPAQTNWLKIASVLCLLGLYALFFERLGFLVMTTLLMALTLKLGGLERWSRIVVTAVGTALITYGIFQVWLQTRLPAGIFGLNI